jgi:small subunit ribosomal protein S6
VHYYELMFIIRPDADEETIKATREKLQSVITESGGEISKMDDLGKRRFAYEIDKYREGIYTVIHFRSNTGVISQLDHVIRISDHVLRHLTINTDEKYEQKEIS